jgi:glycosyltransferase involved in cell wall biosynthesis
MTRVDLHLHSRFSQRPEEWIFRRVGVAKSYSEPRALYDSLRARGFPFFTLTDHHSIEGLLPLLDLPGVFLSEQVTALFPEDQVPVELLIWGLSLPQHQHILQLRKNLYELQRFLLQENLTHAVAHPFFAPDKPLQNVHIEKLLLLFRHFESLNGLRSPKTNQFTAAFLRSLTPTHLDQIADRHEILPVSPRPWEKILVAGSDDQSGLFHGRAWTATPHSDSPEEFLRNIREGRCFPEGNSGGPLTVAHSLYNKIRTFVGTQFEPLQRSPLAQNALSRFIQGKDPTHLSWREKWELAAEGLLSGKLFDLLKPANASFWMNLNEAFDGTQLRQELKQLEECDLRPEEKTFRMANLFAHKLSFHFLRSFLKQSAEGNFVRAIQDLTTLAPLLLPLTPYFVEFKREAPDWEWFRSISRSLLRQDPPALAKRKIAWLTDTLEDVNGVSKTISKLASEGATAGFDVKIITSRSNSNLAGVPLKNFEPIGEFALPEYELQRLSFPPVLEIVDYLCREEFTDILISTPGPVGLTGLLAARLLGLPARGIYHTDFPRYVRILTEDTSMETLAWTFMHWFYNGLDEVFVNSEPYRQAWIDRGMPPSKLRILPRGMDLDLFKPERRRSNFWQNHGAPTDSRILLYVGRLSKEKDLDLLPTVLRLLHDRPLPWPLTLALVGDGPHLDSLKSQLPHALFTGTLTGETLAEAYASADIFVFPSTTDTYGNVVVEALASGLPCVVSDAGGPANLVRHGQTGFVTRSLDAEDFARHTRKLLEDPDLCALMGQQGVESVKSMNWSRAAHDFFQGFQPA